MKRTNSNIMEEKGLVSIVLPTRNRKEDLIKLIKSIKTNTYKNVEIIIEDINSTDGSKEVIKKLFPDVTFIENKLNIGPVKAMNNCIRKSKGEFILRVDNDIIIEKDVIEKLVNVLENDKKIGVTSCLYFYTEDPDVLRGTEIKVNLFTGKTKIFNKDKKYNGEFLGELLDVFAASGCILLARRSIYKKVGLYDENYFFAYDDVDWCLRVGKAGYKVIITSSVKIYHRRGTGIGEKDDPFRVYLTNRDHMVFMKKHAGWRKLIFIPYLFLFLYPAKTFIYLIKNQTECIKPYTKAVFNGLLKNGPFIYDENQKQIPYNSNIK